MPAGLCPECGHPITVEPPYRTIIPWSQRRVGRFIHSYLLTVWLVLFHPRRFSEEVLSPNDGSRADAQSFRRLTVALATLSTMALFFVIARPHQLEQTQVVPTVVAATVVLSLWLNAVSKTASKMFARQTVPAGRSGRLVTLSHYTAAAMLLTPIHPAALLLIHALRHSSLHVLAMGVLLIWAGLTAIQVRLWLMPPLALLRTTMDLDRREVAAAALCLIGLWVRDSLWYLIVIPAALHFIAARILRII
jgi:hypothetical protein